MTYMTKLRPLFLSAAILGAGFAVQAQAQPAAQKPAAEGRMAQRDPEAMMAQRTERLREILQLTPAQEPALKTFMEAMKPPAGMRDAMRAQHQEMASLTTPERLDRMKAMMAQRQAQFDRRAAATKTFYAQLTPAQKKAFDALPPMRGPGHGGHDGGMRGGDGPRRMGPAAGQN